MDTCEHLRRKCTDSRQEGKYRFRSWKCHDCGARYKTAEIFLYYHTDGRRGSVYRKDNRRALARLALVEKLTPEQCEALELLLLIKP